MNLGDLDSNHRSRCITMRSNIRRHLCENMCLAVLFAWNMLMITFFSRIFFLFFDSTLFFPHFECGYDISTLIHFLFMLFYEMSFYFCFDACLFLYHISIEICDSNETCFFFHLPMGEIKPKLTPDTNDTIKTTKQQCWTIDVCIFLLSIAILIQLFCVLLILIKCTAYVLFFFLTKNKLWIFTLFLRKHCFV